ncbi:protein translocase subunit SecDF [Pararhizobium sp. BT-229]|uniref:protein translocase subunit SecDF n=1 Tax=Pararhizobium sp. BT-229 TaxID=2986923 RepID=UPI0021F6EA84|nr:protein translocase subunit SecDF [Pararhizobium sp. BT-229]MCV9965261.1 protein translocase subunit SecDF [Pararhizobium sp. BT-229]
MPNSSRWKTIIVWLVVLLSIVVALPNALPNTALDGLPDWLPKKQLMLGLDLQGGSQITLKIERDDVVKSRLEAVIEVIGARLRSADIAYTGLSGTGQDIQLRLGNPAQIDAAQTVLKPLAAPVKPGGLTKDPVSEVTISGEPDGSLQVRITDQGIDHRLSSMIGDAIAVLHRRLAELGSLQPKIRRQGADRIIVQIPGRYDPEQVKYILSQAGMLSFRSIDMSMAVQDAVNGQPPANSEILYSADDPPIGYLLRKQPIIANADILDARSAINAQSGNPVVNLRLAPDGTVRFAKATADTAGTTVAVVLDGAVIATPLVRKAITDGTVQLAAEMSPEGADDLALLLRAGTLPSPLTVVEERSIGAGRGADSIHSIVAAGAIGAVLVVAFMLAFYGFFGAVASLAVALNVVMIIAVLSATGLALTLPGIAGIVLTIGMAVDSNVLIYERIREEVRHGKSVRDAIQLGFSRAFAAIVDANITMLIAAIILLFLGSGSVRGFAVTLAVGIVTTLFTAFTLTLVMLEIWVDRRHPTALPEGIRTGVFDGAAFRFMAIRNFVFSLTAILSVVSMLLFGALGINLGIDFSGGSVIELKAREGNADIEDISARLDELNLGEITVKPFGSPQDVVVRVHSREGGENAEQTSVILIRGELEDAYDFRRVEVVGPSVSGDLTLAATIGVLASLLAILIYIWVRFEWQFAAGAIVATLHDVLLTIGLFVVTGMEFNLTSVAALLTIVGYSLNDTVVVYDRVRENLRHYPRMPLPIVIDTSINQTLSRTVLTGATTMLALAALCIFGGEAIQSFAFVMLFGVAIGTFSSIYVAGPVLILFKLRHGKPDGDAEKTGGTGLHPIKGAQ